MAENALLLSARYFFIDLLGGIVFFPLWWYSRGLWRAWRFCFGSLNNERQSLAIGVWARNLFVPMYGAADFWGRIISFFMRLAQIFGRLLMLLIYALLISALFVAYLVLPLFIVWEILVNAVGVIL